MTARPLAQLGLLLSITAVIIFSGFPSQAANPPHILVILADDMGYSDAGCYGGEIRTPHLDQLAAEGLRFTQFYNTARCWPTRAALLTGYYAQQVRRDTVPDVRSGGAGVRPGWARLLPELLKPLGYRSYHSGKWHVDGSRLKAGFDRSYSVEDHNRPFHPQNLFEDDVALPAVATNNAGYYVTTAIADHALKCLRDHQQNFRDQPFFHFLCFTAPHFPLQAPPQDIARYQHTYEQGWEVIRQKRWERLRASGLFTQELPPLEEKVGPPYDFPEALEQLGPNEVNRPLPWAQLTESQRAFQASKMAVHAAMVDRMDQEIGRVLDQLREMDVWENTLIIFLSDNGASAEIMVRGDGHQPTAPAGSAASYLCLGPGWSSAANTPFRRHKTWVHEGGISTPLIMHWPRGIDRGGEWRQTPAHVIDLAPSILELAGGHWPKSWEGTPVPVPPGRSLVPVLKQDITSGPGFLWWLHENNRAIRVGDWKLVAAGPKAGWELYDLSKDRGEMHDRASTFPDKVRELATLWERKRDDYFSLAKAQ